MTTLTFIKNHFNDIHNTSIQSTNKLSIVLKEKKNSSIDSSISSTKEIKVS
jgi:hypothetical protein